MKISKESELVYRCKECGKFYPLSEMTERFVCARCVGLKVIYGGRKGGRKAGKVI